MKQFLLPATLVLGMSISLGACSDPYSQNQRAVGGGLLGAGAGAAIGGIAGGGNGALAGGLLGGAAGAAGGALTTPDRPGYREQATRPPPRYNAY